jgi:cation transport ATPase
LASCAEKGSEHPLGQAVARDAEKMLQQWSTATEAGKMGMEKWGSRKAGVKTSRNGV